MTPKITFQKQIWLWVVLVATVSLLVLTACAGSEPTAAPQPTAAPTIPEISIDVSQNGFTVPNVVPGGIVGISIHNTGDQTHAVNLWRIRDGHTRDEVIALNEHIKENPDDFFGAFEIGSWIHFAENIEPDTTYHFYGDLGTGDFFLMDDANPDLDPTFFSATQVVGTVEPEASVTLDMVDFSYVMPDEIPAGKQLWEITNTGEQWHLFAIMKADPDVSFEEILASLGGPDEPPPADSPVEFIGGMPPMSQGERIWMEFDLEAGAYELICPLPDVTALASGAEPLPHLSHGMRRALTVVN